MSEDFVLLKVRKSLMLYLGHWGLIEDISSGFGIAWVDILLGSDIQLKNNP